MKSRAFWTAIIMGIGVSSFWVRYPFGLSSGQGPIWLKAVWSAIFIAVWCLLFGEEALKILRGK